jgi:hypothetical protein
VVTAAMLNAHVRDNLSFLNGSWTSVSLTAASNWFVNSAYYRLLGDVVWLDLSFDYSGATITASSSGNIADASITTSGLPAAVRPSSTTYWPIYVGGVSTWWARTNSDGTITLTHGTPNATIASGTTLFTSAAASYCLH